MTIFLFVLGFIILVKGSDLLIKGAVNLANFFKISSWLVGVFIVGIGTSIPEFGITVFSSLAGQAPVGIGTIIGSNTFNILFILGLCAIITPLQMSKQWVAKDMVFNLVAVVIAFAFSMITLVSGVLVIGRFEGLILGFIFIYWMFYMIKRAPLPEGHGDPTQRIMTLPISILLVIFGLISVIVGSGWVVDGAVALAKTLNASEALVGLTLIGLGTSLPELTVSITAAYRKNYGISVGNVIGSNVFDFLGILGFSALVRPLVFSTDFTTDFLVTILASILLIASMYVGKEYRLKRWQGFFFILIYLSYLIFLYARG